MPIISATQEGETGGYKSKLTRDTQQGPVSTNAIRLGDCSVGSWVLNLKINVYTHTYD